MGKITGVMDDEIRKMIAELNAIEGARVYEVDEETGDFRLGMALPDGTEISAVIESLGRDSYMDLDDTPEVTPPCFLKIYDILAEHDFQCPVNYRDVGERRRAWREEAERGRKGA